MPNPLGAAANSKADLIEQMPEFLICLVTKYDKIYRQTTVYYTEHVFAYSTSGLIHTQILQLQVAKSNAEDVSWYKMI